MSQAIEQLHARISEKLADIEAICAEHKYEVIPTLLLRHDAGPEFSMLLSNDSPSIVVLCIAELGNVGEVIEDDDEATTTPLCITDPDSHFDLLVNFVVDVKHDSIKGNGVAHEAAVAVCESILSYAGNIQKYRGTAAG